MLRSLKVLALASLVLARAGTATAQQPLPDGRTVINRFIDAIGGREAILRQGDRHVTGRFEIPAQGLAGDLEVFAQPPDKLLVKVTLAGIGVVLNGFDGTTGWGVNPMMGPMVLDSLQLRQMKQQADFYSSLYPETQIATLETVAEESYEGATCYKVKVVTTWGEEYFEYFDTTTSLQVGSVRSQASPMGNVEVTTTSSDWRDVDGLKVPFKSVQRTMGIEQVITVTTVETADVPDSVFALPPEIQALVKK